MCWIAHMHTHTYTHKLACHVNPLRWLRQSGWVRLCCGNKEPRNIRPDNNHSGHPAHSTRWTPPPYFSGLYPDTEAYAFYPQAFLVSSLLLLHTFSEVQFNQFATPGIKQDQKIILVWTDWEDIWSEEGHWKPLVIKTMFCSTLYPQDPKHSRQLNRNVNR